MLLDGHQSRFDLGFLKYINNKETAYTVCIGVPYGTSYWQVGDSTQQNGCFKMYQSKFKEWLVNKKVLMMNSKNEIAPTDIIPIVNYAWDRSFAKVESNRHAISERGWLPYNRHILLHKDLRPSMTQQHIKNEKELLDDGVDSVMNEHSTVGHNTLKPTYLSTSTSTTHEPNLNWGHMHARELMSHLFRESDQAEIRQQIKEQKKEGKMQDEELKKMIKITSAGIVKCGKYVLDKDVLDIVEIKQQKIDKEKQMKLEKKNLYYLKICEDADKVLKKDRNLWTAKNYECVLKPLKNKEDGPMPKKLEELKQKWIEWGYRSRKNIVPVKSSTSDVVTADDDVVNVDVDMIETSV